MTKTVSAYEARTKLGELINLIYYGQVDDVVIERMGKPVVKMVRVDISEEKFDKNSALDKLAGAWAGADGRLIKKYAGSLRKKGRFIKD